MSLKATLRLFVLITLLHTNLFAQNFWVPDYAFRSKLKQLYPTCFTAQDSLITNCSQIQSATNLYVSGLNIFSLNGIQYFSSLDSLNCNSNFINSLPPLPSSLTKLYCSGNNLTSLPILPASLTKLICNVNQLNSLPALTSTLEKLICSRNNLSSLPALPASLTDLDCFDNLLTSLPVLPSLIKTLSCNNNLLISLPTLPASLTDLWCYENQLINLPILPASLNRLWCYNNQLSSLPLLPSTLRLLDCSNNSLLYLPALPSSLTELNCFNNQLSSLPSLPNSLIQLMCSNNQLNRLTTLPDSLIILNCSYNQLSALPRIPGKVKLLYFGNNPITCFPEIAPRLPGSLSWQNIFADNTLLSCIPNLGTFPPSIVLSSQTLPLCSPITTSCNYNYTYGHVFIDANGNGSQESLEQGLEVPVYYSGNSGVFPDSSGFFNAASDTGNISFQVAVPNYYTSTTPSVQTIHVVSGIVDTIYFGLQAIPNIKDLKIDLTSIGFLRPGFNASYQLHYQNVGTDTLYTIQLKFLKLAQLANLSAIPAASLVSGDTLIWNIASLIPYQQGDVIITDSVFANAVLGDTARAYAWIEPLVGDTTPLNNSSISTNIIRGAYDPNDKSVSINRVLPNSTDNLEYTIRFQNTGTDTAFTVTLMDKLSSLLDISSMQMISSSHNYELSIVNGFTKWIFKNILLPDSNTNELASHGFVKFRIKPLPGLTVADSIPNAANIYFDYNAAVTTNTIVVNVLNTTQVNELQEMNLQVFPNPVHQTVRIINNANKALGRVELINVEGKIMETRTISISLFDWDVTQLPTGIYIFKGENWTEKILKK